MSQTTKAVRIDKIAFGRNYRQVFAEGALHDLAENMAEYGQHTPIIVRTRDDGRYDLIAGERRTRAAMTLGWETITATIRDDMSADELLAVTLSENMCREQTNPIEDGQGFAKLADLGWDYERIARAAGVSLAIVTTRIALLSLRDDIQGLVSTGQLSIGYARTLAAANLDVNRQLLALVRMRQNPAPTPTWFRDVVGELVEQQAQESMFDMGALIVQSADELEMIEPQDELPPLPSTHKPPRPPKPKNGRGVPRKTAIKASIAYWQNAMSQWQGLGKGVQVAECEGAIKGLEYALLWI